jgi:PLP dependent protein
MDIVVHQYSEVVSLRESYELVRDRIERAARRAGRDGGEIPLVAVTKKFSSAVMREAYSLGMREFGENYVQEFEGKHPDLREAMPEARFHLIGHLQSNKARKAADLFQVIQTVDSVKLARRLGGMETPLEVMIEVKLSGEESKEGADPVEVASIIAAVREYQCLKLTGLMTMPPWDDNPEVTRPYFRRLAALAREHNLTKLSMGMSHDLEAAIEEGATHVRVGTALFGKRPKPA